MGGRAMARDEQGRGRRLKAQERKWSKDLMAGGWTAIPNVIVAVVLAYSGGLDTSIILKWLQTAYGARS
jgi:hypothetical protein